MKKRLEITYPDGRVQIIEGEDLVVYTNKIYHSIRKKDCKEFEQVAALSFACSVVDLSYTAEVKETVEEKTQPVPIKETGHLGITLDTEKPWNTERYPNGLATVEVKLQDGAIKKAWIAASQWYVDNGNEPIGSWPPSSTDNPVVAWRELE